MISKLISIGLIMVLSLLMVACADNSTPTLPPVPTSSEDVKTLPASSAPIETTTIQITTTQPIPGATAVTPAETSTEETEMTITPTVENQQPTTAVESPTPPQATHPAQPATATIPPLPTTLPTAMLTNTPKPLPTIRNVVGIEINSINSSGGFNQVKNLGMGWIRHNSLLWSQVENREGARNWNNVRDMEDQIKQAASTGAQVILIVRSTPDWAQMYSGYLCGPVRLDKLTQFAAFMHDAVARYSVPPYNVLYWEIGNEPDVDHLDIPTQDSPFGCWGDKSDSYFGGGNYAEMLKVVYPQMKAANSQVQVMPGGLLLDCDPSNPPFASGTSGALKDCSPSLFLEGVLRAGGGNYLDGISFHGYDYYAETEGQYANGNWHSAWNTTGPVSIAKTSYLQLLLGRYGLGNKFLINTESAVICGTTGEEAQCTTQAYQSTKAYYMVQANINALAMGLKGNVWYSLTGWRGSGLLDSNQSPNTAYYPFQFCITELTGATFQQNIMQFSGVRGKELKRGDHQIWVLWSLDGVTHNITLPSKPSNIYDMNGNSLTSVLTLDVTIAPIYLEWSP